MALRLRKFKEISRLLPKIGNGFNGRNGYYFLRSSPSRHVCLIYNNRELEWRSFHTQRYSTLPKRLHEPLQDAEFLSFLQSTLDEEKGCSHHWINKSGNLKSSFKKDGIFLIVAGKFFEDTHNSGSNNLISLHKVKSLQQRFPSLQIIGFQPSSSISMSAAEKHLHWRIMAEYVTFPVLLSNKYLLEEDGACCFLFKGFGSPSIHHEKDINLGNLEEAVKSITSSHAESSRVENKLDSPWSNPVHIVKEPYYTSSLRNLFLYFPACISVDEDGQRLFLSDSNHHRIIILDTNAKILDVIGSSPGFEDSEFESSKLMRPAASFYAASEDCLYFVDSENHAIRRADLERRVVETIYPTNTSKKEVSLWSRFLEKIWNKRVAEDKSEESHSDLLFPWHLLKSSNDLFILNQSFDTLWVVDMTSGVMKQVVKGFQSILETCGQEIMEKSSVMKLIPDEWLQQMGISCFLAGVPHGGLISSVSKLNDDVIFCDTVGQMVFKLNGESGAVSTFQFSNFGILGLPYWFSFPLEKVCADDDVFVEMHIDHVEGFSLLPGRVSISVKVAIPLDMDLVEPLSRRSVWCQVRGTAMEISGVESKAEFSEKVGVAQQWYDEIDHLTFTTSEKELNTLIETSASNKELQEGRVCFDCTIATSPGTSEITILAPLYIRLKRSLSSKNQTEKAARIVDILDPLRKSTRDSVIHFLLSSKRDLEELIFVKCLHLRLKFDSSDHPKADNSKGVVLTDSNVEVNVAF